MPTNYLAGMVQPHQIMGQAQQLQTPFQLESQGMQIQSSRNKLMADEARRNALADYAQTGAVESLRAAPDLYFEAMKQQAPDYNVTSVGVGEGMMQRAMINQRDPFGQPILYGSPYYAPGTYQEGMPLPPVGAPTAGIPGQQIPSPQSAADVPALSATQPAAPAPDTKEQIPAAPPERLIGLSKQDQAKVRMADYSASNKSLAEMQQAKMQDQSFIKDIDRFLSLNQEVETGPIAGSSLVAGVRGVTDPNLQEMESISNKLTPMMRQGMPGAASDRDVAMFRGATVGLTKNREANKNVGLGLKTSRQNAIERTNFMQEYFDKNTTLRGADTKWAEYLESNPIFDPEAPDGSYELNPNRQEYKDYFSGKWSPKTIRFGGKKYQFKDQKKYNAWLKAAGQK
jgi:hypothetical protein